MARESHESIESTSLSGSSDLSQKPADEESLEELLKDLLAWLLNVKTALLKKSKVYANPALDLKIRHVQHEMLPVAKNANTMKKEQFFTCMKTYIQQMGDYIHSYRLELPLYPPKRSNEDTHDIAPPTQRTTAPSLIVEKGGYSTNKCIARLAVGQTLSCLVIIKCIFICIGLGGIHPAVGAVAALALVSFILNSMLREKLSDDEEEFEKNLAHSASPRRLTR